MFSFLKALFKKIFRLYQVSPETKVEFWIVEWMSGTKTGKAGNRTHTNTTSWSEFNAKDLFVPDRDFGPGDTLVAYYATINSHEDCGVCPLEKFEEVMDDVPSRTTDERKAWLDNQIDEMLEKATKNTEQQSRELEKIRLEILSARK